MPVTSFQGRTPVTGTDLFLAPTAYIIGDTVVGDSVSIFFNAVLRGDIQRIVVGNGTNIQEGALLHTSHGLADCIVGSNVTIGHGAIVHGCSVGDECIVGMGSCILDGAVIGKHCIIGAQALVSMNTVVPERSLVVGMPAKVVRTLRDDEIESIRRSALSYQALGREYRRLLGH